MTNLKLFIDTVESIFERGKLLTNSTHIKDIWTAVKRDELGSFDKELSDKTLNKTIKGNDTLRFLYAINVNQSDDGKYGVFKYNLSHSNLTKLSRVARGLVLDLGTLEVVSRPFDKFYNINEIPETSKAVVEKSLQKFGGYSVNKLDGSMMNIRSYNGINVLNTGGNLSYAEDTSGYNMLSDATRYISSNYQNALDDYSDYSFMFEFIGELEHTVKYAQDRKGLYLIGMRNVATGAMVSQEDLLSISDKYSLGYEGFNKVSSIAEIDNLLQQPQYKGAEGVVIYSGDSIFKYKLDSYISLNRLKFITDLSKENNVSSLTLVLITLIRLGNVDDVFSNLSDSERKVIRPLLDLVIEQYNALEDVVEAYIETFKGVEGYLRYEARDKGMDKSLSKLLKAKDKGNEDRYFVLFDRIVKKEVLDKWFN